MTLPSQASRFYDNSMLSSYKECPRKYYLRYVLNWRSAGTAMPLVFGLSWHSGQDGIWQNAKKLSKDATLQAAMAYFFQTWTEQGMPEELGLEDIERWAPRTPMVAQEMYSHYIDQRWKMLQEAEVLSVEQPFAVPLPGLEDTWYAGRLDKVVKFQGQTLVIEHKTTTEYKRDGGFRATYVSSWGSDSQVKGYQFGGSLYYKDLSQVWVDAALVHKQVHNAFRFIPIAHSFPLIEEWIGDTKLWVDRLEADRAKGYFPKNEGSCVGKYGACSFLNICRSMGQPQLEESVPEGYMMEEWKPFDVLKLSKLMDSK